MVEAFNNAYLAVFNEDGTLKQNQDPEANKRLIALCEAVDPNTDFGNKVTGKICLSNLDKIVSLYLNSK